jgi:hypothetical protein
MVLAMSEIHMKHKLHMTRDQVRCCCCCCRGWYAVCWPMPVFAFRMCAGAPGAWQMLFVCRNSCAAPAATGRDT